MHTPPNPVGFRHYGVETRRNMEPCVVNPPQSAAHRLLFDYVGNHVRPLTQEEKPYMLILQRQQQLVLEMHRKYTAGKVEDDIVDELCNLPVTADAVISAPEKMAPPTRRGRMVPDSARRNFVSACWEMVSDPANQHAIRFSPDGTCIEVHDLSAFSLEVLPRYFKHNNFSSFVRQLNMYSFEKISSNPYNVFRNVYFVKGRGDLLKYVVRKTSCRKRRRGGNSKETAESLTTPPTTQRSLPPMVEPTKSPPPFEHEPRLSRDKRSGGGCKKRKVEKFSFPDYSSKVIGKNTSPVAAEVPKQEFQAALTPAIFDDALADPLLFISSISQFGENYFFEEAAEPSANSDLMLL